MTILGQPNLCLGVCAFTFPGGAQLLLLGCFDLDLDSRSPFNPELELPSPCGSELSSLHFFFSLRRRPAPTGSLQSSRARAHC